MAGLSVPFLSPSRCVLLITDDALCVYDVTSRSSTLIEAVPWRSPEFSIVVADIIRNRAGGKSVLVLNDAVEQHYRKEKVPKITMFDRASVVQRRLNVAFPNYPIKAALELKDKKKKPGLTLSAPPKSTEGQLYLFAAIPASDAFAKTLDAINKAGVGVSGYCLLPVESSDLVRTLATKLSRQKRAKGPAVWSVMIGQHTGGGLRQIVTKNGELALTRITPVPLPEEVDPMAWCTEVAQEFQSTLSYLARFGYNPEDGLDVMVLANADLGAKLEGLISTTCNYYTVTTPQAAHVLGMNLGRDVNPHYADSLHAAWVGRKPVQALSLKSRDLDKIGMPRKIATAAMILLTLGVGYFSFMLSNEAQALWANKKNLEVAHIQREKIEKLYQEELKRKESMGIDVKLIQGAIALYQSVEKAKVDPLKLLKAVSGELKNLRIDGFEMNNRQPDWTPDPNNPAAQPPPRDFSMVLKFSFAGTIKPQDGNAEIAQFKDRLSEALKPDFEVSIQKDVQDLTYLGQMTEETGLTATTRKADERYQAEVLIKRVVQADDAQSTGN